MPDIKHIIASVSRKCIIHFARCTGCWICAASRTRRLTFLASITGISIVSIRTSSQALTRIIVFIKSSWKTRWASASWSVGSTCFTRIFTVECNCKSGSYVIQSCPICSNSSQLEWACSYIWRWICNTSNIKCNIWRSLGL